MSIIIVQGQTLRQFGTGTLFRVADQSFLVTAAHVIKEAHKIDRGLCITASNDSFVQVHGNWLCSEKGQYGTSSDPFDIAVLPLDSNIVAKLTDYTFLRLHDVNFVENLSRGIFCLCGYPTLLSSPSINNNTNLVLKPFQYATYAYEGLTDALSDYQARFHLLLSANQSDSTDINGRPFSFTGRSGNLAQFPKDLGGISGCSVWIIGNRDEPPENWIEGRPKIVAVQTGVYHRPQIIKATRWIAVSTLLHEAFPELRPAMDLRHVE